MHIVDAVYVYRMFLGEKAAWNGRYHSHGQNEFEIHFFLEGNGSFLSNKKRIAIQNKTLFISAPLEFHSLLPERIIKPLTYYAILFSLDEVKERVMYEQLCRLSESSQKRQIVEEGNVQFIFEEIFQTSNSKNDLLQKSADLLLEGLIYRLFMRNPDCTGTVLPEKKSAINRNHVAKAISIMEKRVYDHVQVEEIAAEIGITAEHFIRIFRETMNITPLQYFYRLKIKTAAAMVSNTALLLSDIAKKMSFENQFHFSRIFKKCTGVCPSEYRKLYCRDIIPS